MVLDIDKETTFVIRGVDESDYDKKQGVQHSQDSGSHKLIQLFNIINIIRPYFDR